MRSEEDNPAYILDMLTAARDIQDFLRGVDRRAFLANKQLQAAIERKIEIIGEAARLVTENFKSVHPEIPWRSIIALRNIVAHDYGDVEQEKMWDVATQKLPDLLRRLEALLPK